jgi:hypothetical protein
LGDKEGIAFGLEGFAILAVAAYEPVRAAQLFGAAEALRVIAGNPRLPSSGEDKYDEKVLEVKTQLGEATFSTAWLTGRTLSINEAVNLVFTSKAKV